jgi:hypothetical protein
LAAEFKKASWDRGRERKLKCLFGLQGQDMNRPLFKVTWKNEIAQIECLLDIYGPDACLRTEVPPPDIKSDIWL